MAKQDGDPPAPSFHWAGPLPAPDFVMIPKLVYREILCHLGGSEFKVFFALLVRAYEWGEGDCELSLNEIAAVSGITRRMTQEVVKTLADKGLIAISRHQSREHGHEANTYRVMVTNDPRYVDRDPREKISLARAERSPAREKITPDRARDPLDRKNKIQEDPPTDFKKYTKGRYAVCPTCGCRPHAPDCPEAS